jgi:DNA-binding MarR family transcriptional regulator
MEMSAALTVPVAFGRQRAMSEHTVLKLLRRLDQAEIVRPNGGDAKALGTLAMMGLVQSRPVPPRPDRHSAYSLTPKGREALEAHEAALDKTAMSAHVQRWAG